MALRFQVTRRRLSFLDPFNQFAPKTLEVEIRRDPLSGDVARILPFRLRELGPVDHSLWLERAAGLPCPFCPEHVHQMTARFLPADEPEGRLCRGDAVCFPNAFPYESMNTVLVLTREHYVRPSQFTPEVLANGLELAREAFARLGRGARFASVNWNYMMPAGAGLVHPHFQLAAGQGPTAFQARVRSRQQAYARRTGGDLAAEYLAAEEATGERWLGRRGPAGWLAAFAPRGIYDFMALAPGRTLPELTADEVLGLAQGLTRVLGFLETEGVGAYNLALHTALAPGLGLPLMLRVVSRVDIPPLGVDEINYFEKLHDEMLSFLRPEEAARRLGSVA
ncbi:MAG: hypothetical protein KQJ78_15120 [Deltaproteobacteria bacterium]|nr:hypothetical protein [Deltaproteobacteria bacterium]